MALLAGFDVLLVSASLRMLATLLAGFGRALRIVLKITAARLPALAASL
jgi:hypothetical protein